jgi:BirA family transcriptional regulator, biotin operon repressor / biotin---[acetyl-CoA-carboxylase] ligase
MGAPGRLSVEAIRGGLAAGTVGRHLYVFGEVDSTNATLRKMAHAGAREGTVVLAESQTQGRGRQGQPWFSPPGVNLYASALFRPAFRPREAPIFSFVASLAVTDAIHEIGLDVAIKWPNDVLVDGKKVAGSLAECATRGDQIEYLILGVGVNVNVEAGALHAALGPAGVAATSICSALGRPVDRDAFAAAYLNRLDAWVARYKADGAGPISAAWRERDILTGRRVEARGTRTAYDGRVLGVDEDGHLVVQDSVGERHAVYTEQIRILD